GRLEVGGRVQDKQYIGSGGGPIGADEAPLPRGGRLAPSTARELGWPRRRGCYTPRERCCSGDDAPRDSQRRRAWPALVSATGHPPRVSPRDRLGRAFSAK